MNISGPVTFDTFSGSESMKREETHIPKSFRIKTAYAKGYGELSSYLDGVSENTLRKWIGMGMPVITIGDVVLFRLADIDLWLDGFRCGALGKSKATVEPSIDEILREIET